MNLNLNSYNKENVLFSLFKKNTDIPIKSYNNTISITFSKIVHRF